MHISIIIGILLSVIIFSDIKHRTISNKLCVSVFAFALYLAILNGQIYAGIACAFTVFFVSLFLFYFKIIAAGDSKLAAALAAALLPGQLLDAVTLTLLAGGALAVFYLIKDRLILKKKPGEERGLPYGVAISFGFYLTIVANSI